MWDLSSWTRDWPGVQCIGRQILNLWTTREVLSLPSFQFFIDSLPFYISWGQASFTACRLCEYEVPFNCSGLSWWLSKESTCNAGNAGDVWETRALSLGSGKSPGGRNGNLLHYSCLKNSKERGLAGYSPRGSQRGTRLSNPALLQIKLLGCQVVLRCVHKGAALPRASLW